MKKKVLIIVIILLVFGFIGMGLDDDSEDNRNEHKAVKQSDDMELVTRKGHPKFLDSVESSHEFWDDDDDEKIVFADESLSSHLGNPVIIMCTYLNNPIIREELSIDFDSFNPKEKVGLKTALSIAASYMPFDIIDKLDYKQMNTEILFPKDTKSKDSTYYNLTYYTDSDTGENPNSIDLMIETYDKNVKSFTIKSGRPNWMNRLSVNGYDTKKWKCDLKDYK